jgi:hypothetical protein
VCNLLHTRILKEYEMAFFSRFFLKSKPRQKQPEHALIVASPSQ